jgi:hypothetical protein
VLIFNAPLRGPSGEFEVSVVFLSVCAVHESVVEDFGMRHAVSEGIWVWVEDLRDLEGLLRANARADPGMTSNAHGPLVLA